jgi:hypothetical protein
MIFFRSAAVVPAQRAAWARPAAAFPPRRPSDTAAGSFLFFLSMGVILSSGRRALAMGWEALTWVCPPLPLLLVLQWPYV